MITTNDLIHSMKEVAKQRGDSISFQLSVTLTREDGVAFNRTAWIDPYDGSIAPEISKEVLRIFTDSDNWK